MLWMTQLFPLKTLTCLPLSSFVINHLPQLGGKPKSNQISWNYISLTLDRANSHLHLWTVHGTCGLAVLGYQRLQGWPCRRFSAPHIYLPIRVTKLSVIQHDGELIFLLSWRHFNHSSTDHSTYPQGQISISELNSPKKYLFQWSALFFSSERLHLPLSLTTHIIRYSSNYIIYPLFFCLRIRLIWQLPRTYRHVAG